MDNCRRFDDCFSDYVEGNLDPEVREETQRHLQSCYRCSAYVRRIQLLRNNLRSLTRLKTSESFEIALRGRLKREMRRESLVERILPAIVLRRAPAFGLAAVVILVGSYFAYQKFAHPKKVSQPLPEFKSHRMSH
ncbi:MAG: anti-sigma factor family protein [Candidatus Aminicenantales bacterium]